MNFVSQRGGFLFAIVLAASTMIPFRTAPIVCTAPGVRVEAAPGAIGLCISELLVEHGDDFVRRLLERLLLCDAVTTATVNRQQGRVTIKYDRRAICLSAALVEISRALWPVPQLAGAGASAPIDLAGVPGSLTRVERRQGQSQGASWAVHYQSTVISGRDVADPDLACAFIPLHHAGHRLPVFLELDGARLVAQLKRLAHLAAAGGCFVMSLVGLVTPGVPTVPFVLATSYFLVRSSPSLNARLRQSRLFGQMARDWEDHGGLHRSTKIKLAGFTLVLLGVTVAVAEISVPTLAAVGVTASLGLWLIWRLPGIPEDQPLLRAASPEMLPA